MPNITSTFALARALGGGAFLSGIHALYIVSDYSPSTGEVYGWRVDQSAADLKGEYARLPDDLCEPMANYAAYMAPRPAGAEDHWRVIGAARHAVYYGEMVTDADKRTVARNIGLPALLASTDAHLNDIALSRWDNMAALMRGPHGQMMAKRGQGLSQSDGVCILKAAARALIADHNNSSVEG